MNSADRVINYFKYKRKLIEIVYQSVLQKRNLTCSAKCNSSMPKILFFGTDNFSLPSLKLLHENRKGHGLGTVTSFKSPANCVRQYAEQQRLQLFRWPINKEICKNYDLGVVVSFGHLIPTEIIKAFPFGMINVHASLLPRWRGAAPIIYALMHGDKETGVSIMKIEPKRFDIGDILAQRRVPITPNCFMPELHGELAVAGAELLLEVVKDFPARLSCASKQSENLVTYAPKITSALTDVVWSELNALQLHDRYRALYGFKYLNTKFQSKNVQLIEIRLPAKEDLDTAASTLEQHKTPGSFMYLRERKCLLVRCASDSFIEIHQLRVEGRKIMTATDFNNGFLKKLKIVETCFVVNKNVASC